jgi:nitroimidazol reductase NimA-like FMN-containing flavoprotein (pyridoxamine 5'-phosphate oxidase superfamily)
VRVEDALYIHGSAASRMLDIGAAGAPLCATVTLLDGLVFARSAFHHSMNYRSVVVLGRAVLVSDPAEKLRVLAALVDRFASGRSCETRAPNALELKATHVLRLSINEASAKLREGPPLDDTEDLAVPCWAGVVPIRAVAQPPRPESALPDGVEAPSLPAVLRLTC